jgi:hypothetical protein
MTLFRPSVKRATRANSPAIAAQASAARKRSSIVCGGISEGKLVTISVEQHKLLDVDRTYQRDRIGLRVNDLIDAIQNGGMIPDPVTLVKRKYAQMGVDQNKLWIIDGQQRVYAFIDLAKPFKAMLHEANSLEDEANFFLAMNNRTIVSSNVIVGSWPGHSGKTIRSAATDPAHALYGKIDFKGVKGGYRASVLSGAMANAVGAADKGSQQDILARIDHAVTSDSHNIARSKAILALIPLVFEATDAHQSSSGVASRVRSVAVRALGAVCYKRWHGAGNAPHPCKKCIYNISRINWSLWAPTNSDRFRGALELEIEKRWKC